MLNRLFHTRPVALVVIVGTVFFALSWFVAVQPALELRAQSLKTLASKPALDDNVARGRAIYIAEGCGFCHSQFVRPTFVDSVYGRATTAEDYAGQHPPMPGTQRTGPDLSAVGKRQPSWMWQFMHLYNPRSMAPESIMPSFPWYFEVMPREQAMQHPYAKYMAGFAPEILEPGLVAVPTQDAVDLVSYLRSLTQE